VAGAVRPGPRAATWPWAAFDGWTAAILVTPDGVRHRVRVQARPGAGRRILGRIEGVDSPEAAAPWVGAELLLPRADLPALEADTWYHHDLIGVPVVTDAGRSLGTVAEIADQGEVDVWICRGGPDGERFIPALRRLLVEVVPGVRIVVADGEVD
jgi:16S rRNA processing protein RimM